MAELPEDDVSLAPAEMTADQTSGIRFTGPRSEGMSFRENVMGAWRSGTLTGALSESADLAEVRGGSVRPVAEHSDAVVAPQINVGRGRRANDETDRAAGELMRQQRRDDAEASFWDQLAYELAPSRVTPSSVAGTVVGSLLSPEGFGGLSSLLVKAAPKLAAMPVARTAADAAIVNTLTDPAVQGIRLASGAQEHYELAQTALAPFVGAAAGGAIAGVAVGASAFARQASEYLAAKGARGAEAPDLSTSAPDLLPEAGKMVDGESAPTAMPDAAPVVAREPALDDTQAALPLTREPGAETGPAALPETPAAAQLDPADRLAQWKAEAPKTLDEIYAAAPANDARLQEAGRAVADATGAEFKPGPPKKREGAESKIARKGYERAGEVTDVVRGGFKVADPAKADEVAAQVASQFGDVIDEGWTVTPAGYFDRKLLVRFEDGSIGEVQIWEPNLLEAKSRGGHKLYEEWRSLAVDDPRRATLATQMQQVYSAALETAGDAWKAVSGSGGRSGHLARQDASSTTLADIATSASSTRFQEPLKNDQASPGFQSAGRPSQTQNVTGTSGQDVAPAGDRVNYPEGETSADGERSVAIPPHRVATADGKSIDVTPKVVEARDLVTSADFGYDASLQPRDRDRAASQAQIREIVARFDPERLGYSAEADRGAPIVAADGTVESGNGRVIAIREVYAQGGEAAERYRAWLETQGVDLSRYEQPVLVRERTTDLDDEARQAFTVAANQSSTLTMSAPERAMADARLVTPTMLDLIRVPGDLAAAGNRDFVLAFSKGMPATERGAMLNAEGAISAEGLSRVRNAIIARAYADSDIIARVSETTDDEVKSISNALVAAAPQWAKLRAGIHEGAVRADMDATASMLEAVKRTADMRAAGQKLDSYLSQLGLYEQIPAPVEGFMKVFARPDGRRAAGAQKIADTLNEYAIAAQRQSADGGLDLGLAPIQPSELVSAAYRKAWSVDAEQTPNLFRRVSDGDGVSPRGGRGEGGREAQGQGNGGLRGDAEGERRLGDRAGQTGPGSDPVDLFRRPPAAPGNPPPNQVVRGRPVADQGTTTPADAKVTRIEELAQQLRDSFGVTLREGRVTQALGRYNTQSGVARVKALDDINTVTHEIAHHVHVNGGAKAEIDALVRANATELAALGAGQGRVGNLEAFAELFRLYTTNRAYAAREYPGATAALDGVLKTKFPDQVKVLEDVRGALDVLHRAESQEVVTADTISAQPPSLGGRIRKALEADRDPSGRKVYGFFDALYTYAIDRYHPVYKAVTTLADLAKANGKRVDVMPVDDAYVLKRLQSGAAGQADTQLRYGVIPHGESDPTGPSLAGAVEKAMAGRFNADTFRDFGAYLVARRSVAEYARFFNGEIPNPPGKYSIADYERAVAQFEEAHPTFPAAAADVYGFLQNHLQRQFDAGLWTKEQFDAARAKVDYVPFARDQGEEAMDRALGVPTSLRYSIVKRFRGSSKSPYNPLETIFKRVHDLEWIASQNDVVNAVARLAREAGPGAGAIAEPIPSHQLKAQRVDVIEALNQAGKQAGVDEQDLGALIKQAEDMLGDSTMATLFRPGDINEKGEPILYHWVGGERRALRLADGRYGRELFGALTAMGDVERNVLVVALQAAQVALRVGVTKAPEFVVVNLIRDQLTAFGTAGRKYIPFVSAARGAYDILAKASDAKAFAGAGGLSGGAVVEMMERSGFGKNAANAIKGGGILGKVAKVYELSEGATRVGLFRSYKKQAEELGFDERNAVLYAVFKSNDYIDFRKFGSKMGVIRRVVPFLNAAVQGTDRELRAAGDLVALETKRLRGETLSSTEIDRLKDARVATLRVMALGMMVGGGLGFMNADEPEFQGAAKHVKDGHFLFKVGDSWISIPKPFGTIQASVNLWERAAEYAVRGDASIAGDWLKNAATAFLPPVHNPALQLAYDVPANYNRFREREIVPYRLQGVEAKDQFTAWTSEFAKMIGSVTGWSPMKVDYTIQALGGGLARDFLFSTDVAMGSDRPQKQIYDYPVLRRFVKNMARGNEATTAFMKLVGEKAGEYEKAENSYRSLIERGQRAEAEKHLRQLDADKKVWTVLSTGNFPAHEERLHPLRNARDSMAVVSGMSSQVANGNVIRIDDLDRTDLTRSRRDAKPIELNSGQKAKLMDELGELSMLTARNAMIDVGAKGTGGLKPLDPAPHLDRIKLISPEVATELRARFAAKHVYDPAVARAAWPEVKRRVLADGENADLGDLVPPGATKRRARRRSTED